MALGATAVVIVRAALAGGLAPLAIGLAAGLAGAFATTELLAGLLYGAGPMDPPTVTAAAVVLVGVAALAIWIPARRAGRSDPARVLSAE